MIVANSLKNNLTQLIEESGQAFGSTSPFLSWAGLLLTMVPYVLTTVLFRISSLALICSMLAELAPVPILIMFVSNLVVILLFSDLQGIEEPLSYASYAIAIPSLSFQAPIKQETDDTESPEDEAKSTTTNTITTTTTKDLPWTKRLWLRHKCLLMLVLSGLALQLAVLWTLCLLTETGNLRPDRRMRVPACCLVLLTTLLSIAGLTSALLCAIHLASQDLEKEQQQQQHLRNQGQRQQNKRKNQSSAGVYYYYKWVLLQATSVVVVAIAITSSYFIAKTSICATEACEEKAHNIAPGEIVNPAITEWCIVNYSY